MVCTDEHIFITLVDNLSPGRFLWAAVVTANQNAQAGPFSLQLLASILVVAFYVVQIIKNVSPK